MSHLDLSENQIKTIPQRAFAGMCPQIWIRTAVSNFQTKFSGLEQLDFLALNHNLLTSLSASHFDGLPNLASLELDYNKIAKIDVAAFKGLESRTSG